MGGKAVLHMLEGVILPESLAEYFTNTTTPIPGRKTGPRNATTTIEAVGAVNATGPAAAGDATNGTANGTAPSRARPGNSAQSRLSNAAALVLLALPAMALGLLV